MVETEGFALAAARVHGGCNMPPACCQEPPFRTLCLFAKKQPIQMDGLFLLAAEEGFEFFILVYFIEKHSKLQIKVKENSNFINQLE